MSKPRYRWWGFVRRMIRDYPSIHKSWEDLHEQSITANLSGMPRGGGDGRTIERIAMRQLPEDDQKVYDAVSRAVDMTKLKPEGKTHLELITLMYWSEKNVTAKAAALRLHISERTAKRWHGDFVRLVGLFYGFQVGTPEPK